MVKDNISNFKKKVLSLKEIPFYRTIICKIQIVFRLIVKAEKDPPLPITQSFLSENI